LAAGAFARAALTVGSFAGVLVRAASAAVGVSPAIHFAAGGLLATTAFFGEGFAAFVTGTGVASGAAGLAFASVASAAAKH